MTLDPLALLPEVDRATERLLRTVDRLDDAATGEPSLLPGWTRGHVLSHLARSADSLVNLLTSARTGEDVPQYPSPAARNADIAAGSARPVGTQLADLRDSARRFAEAAGELPAPAWAAQVRSIRGLRPAATLVWARLREVEVHHVDLDAGYRTADWPDAFGQRLLHEVVHDLAHRDDPPALVLVPAETGQPLTVHSGRGGPVGVPTADGGPELRTVAGPAHELAGWLTGRSGGDGLVVTPAGPLPAPPPWI
ncbi:maleylpyruvate isomerase family mycothiol-dependent enzyme [Micromonospora sp. WMMD1102]|uniref:maleylpyruvate isomerase family mycothiol-dependent enzyme n=1 Tax=Micromonospora sp. WMMD1102 TaxID=3016105 RepID=UPI002415863C|nr:maleylpyruvate isomerase family mycothiol-dependent enzyme [Micromonospora sp. WMMD1102]MDG4788579.1 maleylpyruvate isomerase family mycothiol-dependent enzyme [Micromonospora sp. WMMD1102]MDG4791918.1 maleylpyruvate isomerase family mycothiol-dependent enzyme [Micromonospora sp. WMMD1102]